MVIYNPTQTILQGFAAEINQQTNLKVKQS